MERCKKWEDLNLSRDEVKSIGEALEKEEFRNLLLDYVKEINDPENRRQYEEEITQLENERGVDIKFVHPSSGYVIKTNADGIGKIFINICSNSNVGTPTSTPGVDDGHKGLCWSIPYCLAPPREDVDKKNNLCTVYDVVFHPETLQLTKNVAFKNLVDDTAVRAVEESFHVSLDKINLRFPKMKFKGAKHATVIRKKIENFQEKAAEYTDIPNYPYSSPREKNEPSDSSRKQLKDDSDSKNLCSGMTKYTTPKYTLKHRNNMNIQDYTNDPMAKLSITIPTELVIVIDLPLLRHASDLSIDVTEQSFFLVSENPAKYKLILKPPYKVDSSKGNAKFDTVKKTLTVTLPVLIEKTHLNRNLELMREDSGVDSDKSNERSNSASSSDEDGVKNDSHNSFDDTKASFDQSPCTNLDESRPLSHKFLKSDIHYIRPSFSSKLVKDVLNVTLEVSNVDPESVEYCFVEKATSSGFQMSFSSTGSGFFSVNYAICILLPTPIQAIEESFNVEVWDNNVIVQMKITSLNELNNSCFYVGSDESNLEKMVLFLPNSAEFGNKNSKLEQNSLEFNLGENNQYASIDNERKTKETINEDPVKLDLTSHNSHITNNENICQNEVDSLFQDASKNKECESKKPVHKEGEEDVFDSGSSFDDDTSSPHRQTAKSRTQSESQQGENTQSKSRGILKIRRSLSESSVDDYASWSTEKMEKTKKTVRFSDVISKQTFRMNSSILGQRKKNQRKMKNKKRAQERRLSESGNESEGENDNISRGKQFLNKNENDSWMTDPESSSCDVSEVSEVSDISESDDGLKEDSKLFTPCSNKKNHKRRGKKSARKNAATAKMHYLEN